MHEAKYLVYVTVSDAYKTILVFYSRLLRLRDRQ